MYAKVKFGSHHDISVEDEVTATMEYQNGATGVFVTSTHGLMGTKRLKIVGDKGKSIVKNSEKVIIKKLTTSKQEINAETKASGTTFIFPYNKKKDEFIKEQSFTTIH